jgi:glucose/arabinose dehydrogenase
MLERVFQCWLLVGIVAVVGCGGASNEKQTPPYEPPTNVTLAFEEVELDAEVEGLTDFVFLPSGDEILALAKDGKLHHLALEGAQTRLLGTASFGNIYANDDCGALSLALDPDFENNQFVYVGKCTGIQQSGVFRYRFDPPNYDDLSESEVSIVEVGHPDAERPWHNVGSLNFDDDGYLWVPFGDKVQGDPAQDPSNPLGSLLRIVPNRDEDGSGHEPAPGNPFLGDDAKDPDIYAFGLRSPFRGTFDLDGRFWFADVGSDQFEELNVVTAAGQNFGWPDAEGPCQEGCDQLVDPVTEWNRSFDHDYVVEDEDAAPIGGRVGVTALQYDPSENDQYSGYLDGRFIFSDYCVGFVRGIEYVDDEVVSDEALGHLTTAAAWRQAPDGFVYALSFGLCQSNNENVTDDRSRFYRAVLKEVEE